MQCADIILTDDASKVPAVTEQDCFNSSTIRISDVAILGSQQLPSACSSLGLAATPAVAATGATATGDTWAWACDASTSGRSQLFNVTGSLPCPSSTSSAGSASNDARSMTVGTTTVVMALALLHAAWGAIA